MLMLMLLLLLLMLMLLMLMLLMMLLLMLLLMLMLLMLMLLLMLLMMLLLMLLLMLMLLLLLFTTAVGTSAPITCFADPHGGRLPQWKGRIRGNLWSTSIASDAYPSATSVGSSWYIAQRSRRQRNARRQSPSTANSGS